MTEYNDGYPQNKALDIARIASAEIEAFFDKTGIKGVHVIANATGWGNLEHALPHIGVYLPEGVECEKARNDLSPILERLAKERVGVTLNSYEQYATMLSAR